MFNVTIMVAGSGSFPLDMLRYDCCYPNSPEDAEIIRRSCEKVGSWTVRVTKKVRTNSETANPLAAFRVDRWRSFGAECSPRIGVSNFTERGRPGCDCLRCTNDLPGCNRK